MTIYMVFVSTPERLKLLRYLEYLSLKVSKSDLLIPPLIQFPWPPVLVIGSLTLKC